MLAIVVFSKQAIDKMKILSIFEANIKSFSEDCMSGVLILAASDAFFF